MQEVRSELSSIIIHFSGRDGFPSTLLMVRVPVVGMDDNLTIIHCLGVNQICFTMSMTSIEQRRFGDVEILF